MSRRISVKNLQWNDRDVIIEGIPDFCPLCHKGVRPEYIAGSVMEEIGGGLVQAVFRCPIESCQELFIGTYTLALIKERHPSTYKLHHVAPINAEEELFSETIKGISPSFVEIYNQAIAAEAQNLSQIVGIGLRKALEFLVKDFAIAQSKDNEEEIKAGLLGTCIDKYIDDVNVKGCARRAAWLGNDETHYIRKWDDKDIHDLKLLVKLTVNWIENVLLTNEYIEGMNGGGT
jgi:hypothetical protein